MPRAEAEAGAGSAAGGTAKARGPRLAHRIDHLREALDAWRAEGLRIALVPTMGALHEGHLSLIRMAKQQADKVVVSIFVNPRQFGPTEDFDAYPRTLEQDVFKVGMAGGHLVFAPTVSEMYPPGFATTVAVSGVSEGLCGGARPGHFDGVATVVAKLLNLVAPDGAFFGEKDYQQLMVIRRVAADLNLPGEIVGVPVVRELDGLAMSSRNAYLSDKERATANRLNWVLRQVAEDLRTGRPAAAACAGGIAELESHGFAPVDYLELRAAEDLAPMDRLDRPARLLVAAVLGTTRLIDNVPVEPS
jgi:pantoate--beta-alanine ligase